MAATSPTARPPMPLQKPRPPTISATVVLGRTSGEATPPLPIGPSSRQASARARPRNSGFSPRRTPPIWCTDGTSSVSPGVPQSTAQRGVAQAPGEPAGGSCSGITQLAASRRRSSVFECVSELLHGTIVLVCGQGVAAGADEGNRPFQYAENTERPEGPEGPEGRVKGELLRLGQAHRTQHRKSHRDVAGLVHLHPRRDTAGEGSARSSPRTYREPLGHPGPTARVTGASYRRSFLV